MSNSEPASLTAHLLVKKGGAKPAGFGGSHANENQLTRNGETVQSIAAAEPAHANETEVADWTKALARQQPQRSASSPDQRARLTLRLDPDRHLRLKLTAAHLGMSLQELATSALDAYINAVSPEFLNGDCTCISMSSPRRTPHRAK